MNAFLCLLLVFSSVYAAGHTLRESPQQALNHYVAFLNQSSKEVAGRFRMMQAYYPAAVRHRTDDRDGLRLESSGPLEEYYYKKALESENGLSAEENERLQAGAKNLWKLLEKLDQTAKTLEVYVRLKDYQRDGFKQSDALVREIQELVSRFGQEKEPFYQLVQRVYRRYQPFDEGDAYLVMEKEMKQALTREKQLLESWMFYLDETGPSAWPAERFQESIPAMEESMAALAGGKDKIAYPASGMVDGFVSALRSIQDVKRNAVNNNTFAARQSARHGNEVYLNLINHYNNDLLATFQSFVGYSRSARQLLDFPAFSPVFGIVPPPVAGPKEIARTPVFRDAAPIPFTTKPVAEPVGEAAFRTLNGCVDFVNESLRAMNQLQLTVRNYQSTADDYRDPVKSRRRSPLTYSHDSFKIPASEYQLVIGGLRHVPEPYRASLQSQAEVLMNILKEMDGLSIELIAYTGAKQYEEDRLRRSDEILERYAVLFDTFDQRKERFYNDVRRVYESYRRPADSWQTSAIALLNTVDEDKRILFGIRAYLQGEAAELPATERVASLARALLVDEYQNLKGLTRYGRSNGLCPYSPYEDIAENSMRFAEKAHLVKAPAYGSSPYEDFYYFYNNRLVYEYNKFSELAKTRVLKTILQPNLLILRRRPAPKPVAPPVAEELKPAESGPAEKAVSLTGYATNNMVLLLDVSASMDSPYKLPLLKKSVKSLLPLLRLEDRISIVVYSGRARVALPPTPGTETEQIARVIEGLQSTGETDGNDGIRLAYRVVNKGYLQAGNNRIILATDGEFPISDAVYRLVEENARRAINLTVFTFNRNDINAGNLKKLATLGKGSYEHVTAEKADLQLILEAQARKAP
ncbi:vWA domain-containing protein [Larkinella soli]|uniref:vWA domain-containing protein n=1 Tax=Larkinella soli TaxID=1770527 RepID=UPI000FFBC72D|nr:VWA domain-containing protein [Larkinella soli]